MDPKILATFLAFVIMTFAGTAAGNPLVGMAPELVANLGALTPATAPAPAPAPTPAPAAPTPVVPAAPAPAPTPATPESLPAKRDEEEEDENNTTVVIEPPTIRTRGMTTPVATLNHSLDATYLAEKQVIAAEANWTFSEGQLGVTVLNEFIQSNAQATQWMTERLRVRYDAIPGAEKLEIFHSTINIAKHAKSITTPRSEETLVSYGTQAMSQGNLVVMGANSSLELTCWEERGNTDAKAWVPTAMGVLAHEVGNLIEVTQYALSALNANVQGPGFVNASGNSVADIQAAGIRVFYHPFDQPIGTTTVDGASYPLYLPSRKADGTSVVTRSRAGRAGAPKAFQTRGFVFGKKLAILKGATETVEDLLYYQGELWTPAKDGWSEEVAKKGEPVLVPDLHTVPKGAGKKVTEGLVTDPVCAWSIVDWANGKNRPLERTRMSFQLTLFFVRAALGEKLWAKMALSHAKVEAAVNALLEKADSSKDKGLTKRLFKELGVELTDSELALAQVDVEKKVLDLMAAGTETKLDSLKVLANDTIPLGCVVLDPTHVHHSQNDLLNPRAAMMRMPTISPLSVTAPFVIRTDMLASFAKHPDSPTSEKWAEVLRNQHNRITKRNGWQADYPEITTLNEMKLRLRLLEREIRGAEVLGVVRANPKDGILRNEDQDGDGSGCDTHLEVVEAFAAVEEHWANMAQPFTIELPKAFQRPWTHPKLVSSEMGELGMTVHPKGNRVLDGVNGGLPLVPSPAIQGCWDNNRRRRFAYQVANVGCREPKGPVGMWSNVGADLFMRIRWTTDTNGKLIPEGSPRNLAIYWAWVYSCMLTQFMIDWQKRAYDLLSIEHYREVAKLMVEARGDEEKMTRGYTELLRKFGSVNLDSKIKLGSKEQLELAENWGTEPSIPYAWANVVINEGITPSKKTPMLQVGQWKSKTWWDEKKFSDHCNDLPTEPESLNLYTYALLLGAGYEVGLDGIRKPAGHGFITSQRGLVAELRNHKSRIMQNARKLAIRNCSASKPLLGVLQSTLGTALREIAAVNGKLGDPNALRKIGAIQVMRTWMAYLEMPKELQDKVLAGEASDDGTVHRKVFLAAALKDDTLPGSLPLWMVVRDAAAATESRSAIAKATARIGLTIEKAFGPNGWVRTMAAQDLARDPKTLKFGQELASSDWTTTSLQAQKAIWGAVEEVVSTQMSSWVDAAWRRLKEPMGEGEESYIEALTSEPVRRAEVAKEKMVKAQAKIVETKALWNAGNLIDQGGVLTHDAYITRLQQLGLNFREAKAEYRQIRNEAQREVDRTIDAVFAPLKKAWLASSTMVAYDVTSKTRVLGKGGMVTTALGLQVAGQADMARVMNPNGLGSTSRGWNELQDPAFKVGARRWPDWVEGGGTAAYEGRYSTCPKLAMSRWAANGQAIGPAAPIKAALAFVSPLLGANLWVQSYTAFPRAGIVTRDAWDLALSHTASFKRNAAFRSLGRGWSGQTTETGLDWLAEDGSPYRAFTRLAHTIKNLANYQDQRGGRGFVPPLVADTNKRREIVLDLLHKAAFVVTLEVMERQDSDLYEEVVGGVSDEEMGRWFPHDGGYSGPTMRQWGEYRINQIWETFAEVLGDSLSVTGYEDQEVEAHLATAKERLLQSTWACQWRGQFGSNNDHPTWGAVDAWRRSLPAVVAGLKDELAAAGWQ